jgi:AraC-like DNA-binding protein
MNCSFDFLHHTIRGKESFIDYHSHSNFELVYYVNGMGTTNLGNETYRYTDRSFTLIPPGCEHNEYRATDTEVIFICFYYNHDPVNLDTGLFTDRDGTVYQLLKSIMDEMGGRKSYFDMAIHGLLCQLIAEVCRYSEPPDNPPVRPTGRQEADEKIRYAKNFLKQYCSEKIDLTGLAHNLGYSYDHFRHLFKRSTGYSPSQYMIRNRIEQAKKKLTDTDIIITTIGLECGFSNPAQFSMMFKKDTGLTPTTYRDQFSRAKL